MADPFNLANAVHERGQNREEAELTAEEKAAKKALVTKMNRGEITAEEMKELVILTAVESDFNRLAAETAIEERQELINQRLQRDAADRQAAEEQERQQQQQQQQRVAPPAPPPAPPPPPNAPLAPPAAFNQPPNAPDQIQARRRINEGVALDRAWNIIEDQNRQLDAMRNAPRPANQLDYGVRVAPPKPEPAAANAEPQFSQQIGRHLRNMCTFLVSTDPNEKTAAFAEMQAAHFYEMGGTYLKEVIDPINDVPKQVNNILKKHIYDPNKIIGDNLTVPEIGENDELSAEGEKSFRSRLKGKYFNHTGDNDIDIRRLLIHHSFISNAAKLNLQASYELMMRCVTKDGPFKQSLELCASTDTSMDTCYVQLLEQFEEEVDTQSARRTLEKYVTEQPTTSLPIILTCITTEASRFHSNVDPKIRVKHTVGTALDGMMRHLSNFYAADKVAEIKTNYEKLLIAEKTDAISMKAITLFRRCAIGALRLVQPVHQPKLPSFMFNHGKSKKKEKDESRQRDGAAAKKSWKPEYLEAIELLRNAESRLVESDDESRRGNADSDDDDSGSPDDDAEAVEPIDARLRDRKPNQEREGDYRRTGAVPKDRTGDDNRRCHNCNSDTHWYRDCFITTQPNFHQLCCPECEGYHVRVPGNRCPVIPHRRHEREKQLRARDAERRNPAPAK